MTQARARSLWHFRKWVRGRVVPLPRAEIAASSAKAPTCRPGGSCDTPRSRPSDRSHAGHRPATPRRAWYVWKLDMSLQAGGLVLVLPSERRQHGTFARQSQGVCARRREHVCGPR